MTIMIRTGTFSKSLALVGLLWGSIIVLGGGGCAYLSSDQPEQQVVRQQTRTFQEGQRLFDQGEFQRAMSIWEQVLPTDKRYVDAQIAIRSTRLHLAQLAEQEQRSRQISDQMAEYLAQAERLEQAGDVTGALRQYEQARQLEPNNLALYNKIEELHALLDNTLERSTRLGDLYLAQGEYEKSKAEWERLLQVAPSNEKAKQRLADLEVLTATSDAVFVKRGRALLEKGLVKAAQAEFEKAQRINPANDVSDTYLTKLQQIRFTEYRVQKGDTLSSIAQRYTGNSSLFAILADFNAMNAKTALKIGQAIRIPHVLAFKKVLAPDEADLVQELASSSRTTRGVQTAAVGTTPLASADITRLLENGLKAFDAGDYREAVRLLQEVVLQDPENERAYQYFVQATQRMQRGTTGGELTQIADRTDRATPSSNPAAVELTEGEQLLQTALTYREQGDLRQAITLAEQALQIEPQNPAILTSLEDLRDQLKQLITAYLNEGIKHFNQEALGDAIASWEKVLQLDPTNRQAADYKDRAEKLLKTLAVPR